MTSKESGNRTTGDSPTSTKPESGQAETGRSLGSAVFVLSTNRLSERVIAAGNLIRITDPRLLGNRGSKIFLILNVEEPDEGNRRVDLWDMKRKEMVTPQFYVDDMRARWFSLAGISFQFFTQLVEEMADDSAYHKLTCTTVKERSKWSFSKIEKGFFTPIDTQMEGETLEEFLLRTALDYHLIDRDDCNLQN